MSFSFYINFYNLSLIFGSSFIIYKSDQIQVFIRALKLLILKTKNRAYSIIKLNFELY